MYFADIEVTTGKLRSLRMIPTQVKRFRIKRAKEADAFLLHEILNREGKKFASNVGLSGQDGLTLLWR